MFRRATVARGFCWRAEACGASFVGSQLVAANFTSADLTNTSFSDSQLAEASFERANVHGATFEFTPDNAFAQDLTWEHLENALGVDQAVLASNLRPRMTHDADEGEQGESAGCDVESPVDETSRID